MSKSEKREQKIRNRINNITLTEFEALIKSYGEIIEGHSHPKAHIKGHIFPYKRSNPVSAYYVERILKIIDGIE